MALDPATQKICEGLGSLRAEIKSLSQRFDSKCESQDKCIENLQERMREREINGIDKADHKVLVDKIDKLTEKVAYYIGGFGVVLTLVFLIISYVFKN